MSIRLETPVITIQVNSGVSQLCLWHLYTGQSVAVFLRPVVKTVKVSNVD